LSKRSIYDNLNQGTLGDINPALVSQNQEPINIMEINEQSFETLNKINGALFRDGNPIPNSGQILISDPIQEAGFSAQQVICAPRKGEVLEVMGISLVFNTSPTGSVTSHMYYQDRNGTNLTSSSSESNSLYDSQSSASINTAWTGLFSDRSHHIIVAYPLQLILYIQDMKGTSSAKAHVVTHRLR